eukprot:6109500-Prymnesium_polylepis.1
MTVQVNRLSDGELRRQIAFVPRFPGGYDGPIVDAILSMRPFADAADFLRQVNVDAVSQRQRVGPKVLAHFDFAPADDGEQPSRTRNVVYARELLGLFVDVPWS